MFRVWHELGRYSRCSISACGIKCALNKSIGNMKWHISKNVINHRETTHLWNNECHTTKYDTNVRYYYFKNTLCNIARVVGIKSWVIILISQRRECQVFLSLIYIRVNYDTVQQTWKKKKPEADLSLFLMVLHLSGMQTTQLKMLSSTLLLSIKQNIGWVLFYRGLSLFPDHWEQEDHSGPPPSCLTISSC